MMMVQDAMLLCLSKVFGLMFTEEILDPSQLYNELGARFGESILVPAQRQKIREVQNNGIPNVVFTCESQERCPSTQDEDEIPQPRYMSAPLQMKFGIVEADYML